MSTAVILEGQIQQQQSENDLSVVWNGHWRFIKDKKGTLQFNYKKIGYEVPKDLLDYVSFLDPATIALTQQSHKSSSHSKHRKRGRGRPPLAIPLPGSNNDGSLNSSTNIPISEENSKSQIQVNELKVNAAESNINDNSSGEHPERQEIRKEDEEGDLIVLEDSLEFNESTENTGMQEDIDNEPVASVPPVPSTVTPTSSTTVAPTNIKPFLIRNIHPLAGVWKGNFSITTLKGEELVEETLFFYSMLGGEQYEQFKDLPPAPQFPYTLLRRIEQPKGQSTSTSDDVSPGGIASANSFDDKSQHEIKLEHGSELEKSSTDPNQYSSNFIDVDPESIQDDTTATLAFGYSAAVLEGLYRKVLIGFGRNPLGRFSVAAIYDEATKEFRCEKKYMAVKYAVKRGRRSHAEYALNYASQQTSTNISMPPPAPVERTAITRKHSVSSIVDATPSVILPARNRTNKLAQYIEEEANLENATKRKRVSSGTFKLKGKSKDWTDPTFQSNLHALAGIRNPDNDDPSCTFREAFQDCDTGEIYEGGWAFGMRNGKGICVYADGLMYEGNWYRGKEHGRGELMTGDRRVIYSGDWLDGQIHGYGTYNFGNGDRYIGDWKEGVRHGKGEYTIFSNGCSYIGDWRDNKRHGKGKFIWPDTSFYEGDWENDTRHGRGVLDLANGFHYDGFWVHNVMEGKGTCSFPSGQTYQGTYKSGLRDGRGSVQFAEGPIYEGRFKEDRFDGQGTLKIANNVPGIDDQEVLIPIQIQSDLSRIHWKAGFGANAH